VALAIVTLIMSLCELVLIKEIVICRNIDDGNDVSVPTVIRIIATFLAVRIFGKSKTNRIFV